MNSKVIKWFKRLPSFRKYSDKTEEKLDANNVSEDKKRLSLSRLSFRRKRNRRKKSAVSDLEGSSVEVISKRYSQSLPADMENKTDIKIPNTAEPHSLDPSCDNSPTKTDATLHSISEFSNSPPAVSEHDSTKVRDDKSLECNDDVKINNEMGDSICITTSCDSPPMSRLTSESADTSLLPSHSLSVFTDNNEIAAMQVLSEAQITDYSRSLCCTEENANSQITEPVNPPFALAESCSSDDLSCLSDIDNLELNANDDFDRTNFSDNENVIDKREVSESDNTNASCDISSPNVDNDLQSLNSYDKREESSGDNSGTVNSLSTLEKTLNYINGCYLSNEDPTRFISEMNDGTITDDKQVMIESDNSTSILYSQPEKTEELEVETNPPPDVIQIRISEPNGRNIDSKETVVLEQNNTFSRSGSLEVYNPSSSFVEFLRNDIDDTDIVENELPSSLPLSSEPSPSQAEHNGHLSTEKLDKEKSNLELTTESATFPEIYEYNDSQLSVKMIENGIALSVETTTSSGIKNNDGELPEDRRTSSKVGKDSFDYPEELNPFEDDDEGETDFAKLQSVIIVKDGDLSNPFGQSNFAKSSRDNSNPFCENDEEVPTTQYPFKIPKPLPRKSKQNHHGSATSLQNVSMLPVPAPRSDNGFGSTKTLNTSTGENLAFERRSSGTIAISDDATGELKRLGVRSSLPPSTRFKTRKKRQAPLPPRPPPPSKASSFKANPLGYLQFLKPGRSSSMPPSGKSGPQPPRSQSREPPPRPPPPKM